VADTTISNKVAIVPIPGRRCLSGASWPRLFGVPERPASNRLASFPHRRRSADLRSVLLPPVGISISTWHRHTED
jgi:hypothetical protein